MAGRTLGLLALMLLLAGPASAGASGGRAELTGVVNLNAATLEQLDALPGVGPKAAQAILAYRARKPFRRVEELVRVKGIGLKRLEQLRPYVAVGGETTLRRAPAGKEVARR
ncbi:MAG: ComEA family DNA-binding protein [Myxococcaceae bacterium]|nr:ComEA family DNA-binding protein [Myxococcaceae bacterium]MCI0671978.1 ComEA family DNA-binding protein [Myxococcaceae bacterium]